MDWVSLGKDFDLLSEMRDQCYSISIWLSAVTLSDICSPIVGQHDATAGHTHAYW